MSAREKTLASKTLVCLLQGLAGSKSQVRVEFRDETAVTGKIQAVDGYMNIEMVDVTYEAPSGSDKAFAKYCCQGKFISNHDLHEKGEFAYKLLMLGSDGPNVNKAVFKIFDHRLKSEVGEGLVNVGMCNLHIVHNAFGEGLQLDAFASIIDFLEDIDIWFRKYPSRKEDLIISSQCVDEEVVCNTLRLSVVPSCQRILKMYPALKQHFLVDLVGNKSNLIKTERYKRIRSALKSHLTPAYLHFLVSVGKIFDKFLRFLQSDKILIHLLYDEMSNIVRKLLFRFISMESCQEKKDDLLEIPLKSIMEKENLKYLDVGHEANKILSSIEAAAKRCFKLDAQNFYFSVTSYLLKKLPLKNQMLKSILVLHPVARKEPVNKTIGVVKRLTKMLSRCVQLEEMDKILDEWRIYVSDEEIKEE
ncbi:hypothetical protein AVEN_224108-1 [Araneus ventricosus]|uniref:Sm domain-containing protein n=1 Tax=Araneus ventricosus TaxID=182803 RepID=A0A4Y2DVH7_ARAVE|nr:hypothetical protein AVEN_224108-1 [Araneus ventricosus]